jgi:pyruvate dehydrogenase E2 component (dihydrolipoamide acetyltransferase)
MALREVRLPALTTTMEEAELVEWRVEVGDEVHEGQPLVEVVTDKVDMELESPFDGTVSELLVDAGSVVSVGTVVARVDTESDDLLGGLGLEGEDADADADAADTTDGTADGPAADPAAGDGLAQPRVPAPPPVRIRAREAGVDLADVPRTGRRGQVTTDDLRRYLEAQQAPAATSPAAPPTGRLRGSATTRS